MFLTNVVCVVIMKLNFNRRVKHITLLIRSEEFKGLQNIDNLQFRYMGHG